MADHSQNAVTPYIHRFNLLISEKAYASLHNGEKLSANQVLLVKYHSYGTMGLFLDWLDPRSRISAEQWAEFQYERTPDFLKEAFGAYCYSTEEIYSALL